MAFVRLGVYEFQPGTIGTVIYRDERELLPFFQQQPGFVSYEVVCTGDDTGVSSNHWTIAEQAEQGTCQSGRHPNCCISRVSSPGWSPTDSVPDYWLKPCHSVGLTGGKSPCRARRPDDQAYRLKSPRRR
jgi:hypothetical protein